MADETKAQGQGQFGALAMLVLFDRMLRRLEAKGLFTENDRKTIIDEAISALRAMDKPLPDRAAEMIEKSFNVPTPPGSPPPRQD